MKPSSPKSALQATDREWVDRTTAILSGGATIADQMSGELVSFRWNSTKPPSPIALRKLTRRPLGLLVLDAKQATDPSTGRSGTAVVWSFASTKTGTSLSILDMALAVSTDFDVVAWAIGG